MHARDALNRHLRDSDHFRALLRNARRQPWVVYSKAPMAGPEQVLKYLARYTHRVAIANSRLISHEDGRVSFRYKDYAHDGEQRILSLDAREFLRRFLLHVLPRGFARIRHYGLLANCCRRDKIAVCRKLIGDLADHRTDGDGSSFTPVRTPGRSGSSRCTCWSRRAKRTAALGVSNVRKQPSPAQSMMRPPESPASRRTCARCRVINAPTA
jgi:Putative transposase